MTWADKSSRIAPGDKVGYRTAYLFAEGLMRTELPHLSGTVTGIEGDRALIEWDSPHDKPSLPLSQLTRLPERGIIE